MDRKTIDALLETVAEMVNREYGVPLQAFMDHVVLELISTGAIDAVAFSDRMTTVLREVDLGTPGAKLLLRAREICRMASEAKLPVGLVRGAARRAKLARRISSSRGTPARRKAPGTKKKR